MGVMQFLNIFTLRRLVVGWPGEWSQLLNEL